MITVVVAALILLIGAVKRVDVYASFVEGAQDGLRTALKVTPYLCAALMVTAALRGSGLMQAVGEAMSPGLEWLGIPQEMLPFLVMRPVSGSGALSALGELMQQYGADSAAARMAAVMMGSSETVLYVLAVYLGAAGMRSGRYVLWAALVSMGTGIALAVILMKV